MNHVFSINCMLIKSLEDPDAHVRMAALKAKNPSKTLRLAPTQKKGNDWKFNYFAESFRDFGYNEGVSKGFYVLYLHRTGGWGILSVMPDRL